LDEHDTDLGFVTPDGLASSDGLAGDCEIEDCGNADRSLNFQARTSLGDIPNRARDRMISEKDFPGLQYSSSRRLLPSIHVSSLLYIGDQSEMRSWITSVYCIADIS
jgi:hypothetical protein